MCALRAHARGSNHQSKMCDLARSNGFLCLPRDVRAHIGAYASDRVKLHPTAALIQELRFVGFGGHLYHVFHGRLSRRPQRFFHKSNVVRLLRFICALILWALALLAFLTGWLAGWRLWVELVPPVLLQLSSVLGLMIVWIAIVVCTGSADSSKCFIGSCSGLICAPAGS